MREPRLATQGAWCLFIQNISFFLLAASIKRYIPILISEQLTVQIPLHNPWHVPLVLTNVHLIWKAWFTPSPPSSDIDLFDEHQTATNAEQQAKTDVSNDDTNPEKLRTARKFVVTESIGEFYMLPGDRKPVGCGGRQLDLISNFVGRQIENQLTGDRASCLPSLVKLTDAGALHYFRVLALVSPRLDMPQLGLNLF